MIFLSFLSLQRFISYEHTTDVLFGLSPTVWPCGALVCCDATCLCPIQVQWVKRLSPRVLHLHLWNSNMGEICLWWYLICLSLVSSLIHRIFLIYSAATVHELNPYDDAKTKSITQRLFKLKFLFALWEKLLSLIYWYSRIFRCHWVSKQTHTHICSLCCRHRIKLVHSKDTEGWQTLTGLKPDFENLLLSHWACHLKTAHCPAATDGHSPNSRLLTLTKHSSKFYKNSIKISEISKRNHSSHINQLACCTMWLH